VKFKNEHLIYLATVDTFSTSGLNCRVRKYAQCGPRPSASVMHCPDVHYVYTTLSIRVLLLCSTDSLLSWIFCQQEGHLMIVPPTQYNLMANLSIVNSWHLYILLWWNTSK